MDEQTLLKRYPVPTTVKPDVVAKSVRESGRVLIVLDDDPTGTQSVSDLPVLTRWEESDLDWAFEQGAPAIYVLTNSRSLTPHDAARVNREVAAAATEVARKRGAKIGFVSRGDSTLRGHFPLEPNVLKEELRGRGLGKNPSILLVPAFPDAGRVTIGGIHWVKDGNELYPVGESEFAKDATFGYEASDLTEWVEERSGGQIPASEVTRLTLDTLRKGVPAIVAAIQGSVPGSVIAVDACVEDDLRLLALGLEEWERAGGESVYRVGPPFVRARIGQSEQVPLGKQEIDPNRVLPECGGLIVVGSHVGLTSRQLDHLNRHRNLTRVELDVTRLRQDGFEEVQRVASAALVGLKSGDVVIYTSRALLRSDDPDESLAISREVSEAVAASVAAITAAGKPRFVVAKGGITSSDVATKGLGITRAMVRGPMLPGIVSLWEPADGYTVGVPYVIFPGNVGDETSLTQVVSTLSAY